MRYAVFERDFCMDDNVVIVRCEVLPCTPHEWQLQYAGMSIGGVDLAYRDHATMQAHHRHMQELFGQHTVFMIDAAFDSTRRGKNRSRDDGPSVRRSDTDTDMEQNRE